MDMAYLQGINYDPVKHLIRFPNPTDGDSTVHYQLYSILYKGLMDARVPCIKPIGFYFVNNGRETVRRSKLLVSDYCVESLPEVIEELSKLIFYNIDLTKSTGKLFFKGSTMDLADGIQTSNCRGYGNNKLFNGASAYRLMYTNTQYEKYNSSKPTLADFRQPTEQVAFQCIGNDRFVYTPKQLDKVAINGKGIQMVVLLSEGVGNIPMRSISSMFIDPTKIEAESNKFVYLNTNFSYIDHLRILPRTYNCIDSDGSIAFKVAGNSDLWNYFTKAWIAMTQSPEKSKWLNNLI